MLRGDNMQVSTRMQRMAFTACVCKSVCFLGDFRENRGKVRRFSEKDRFNKYQKIA